MLYFAFNVSARRRNNKRSYRFYEYWHDWPAWAGHEQGNTLCNGQQRPMQWAATPYAMGMYAIMESIHSVIAICLRIHALTRIDWNVAGVIPHIA